MALLQLFVAFLLCSVELSSSSPIGYGYKLVGLDHLNRDDGVVGHLELIRATETYGKDIKHLKLVARYQSGDRLQVHISDADSKRYEVPQELLPRDPVDDKVTASRKLLGRIKVEDAGKLSSEKHQLEFHYVTNPFGFAVVRRSNGEVLFNTSAPDNGLFNSMIFKDQYLEISSQLPFKSALYGLGESTRPDGLRLAHNRQYTMWATDIGSWNIDIDLYGTFPFVMDVRDGGLAHGVELMNSNGMDVDYNDTSITFKIIGGLFDFYFFPGSSPLAVVDQHTQLVGRPAAMPYWVLGFHQSRYGYKNVEQLDTVMKKYAEVKLPVESMWSDIDHMDRYMDFTLDPVNYPREKLLPFVEKLHKNHQKFIMILDPGIKIDRNYSTYVRGDKLDIFMRNETRDRYVAQVWPGATNIPDFLHPKAQEFWSTEVAEFHKVIPFDGLWLDMNEPANFCGGPTCFYPAENVHQTCPQIDECCMICDNTDLNRWDDPPYHINSLGIHRPLYAHTMAMSCEHYNGIRAYDTHNVYGMSEGIATYRALKELTGKRPFVLARSMFLGSGSWAAHWTGDNGATWGDLQYSIVSVINSGMFGVPMVGADICGFNFQTDEELCIRWTQVGAFYPFSRDHSDIHAGPQEFYLWESVTETARSVFAMRYKLLPYLYTLMYGAHKTGAPIFRPLFFAVPEDARTLSIGDQFLLGTDILVSPVVKPETYSVNAYFPAGVWYNLFNPSQVIHANNSYHELPAPLDTINAHVRSGSIIPMQDLAPSTTQARKTPYTLLIAMEPEASFSVVDATASGELFIDDDDTIVMEIKEGTGTFVEFQATRSFGGQYVLKAGVKEGAYAVKQGFMLQTISVLGVQAAPSLVKVNGKAETVNVTFDDNALSLTLTNLNLPIGKNFEVTWDSALSS
jgi:alpha-glucosidase (family GH31 glycosyl hydrolase)